MLDCEVAKVLLHPNRRRLFGRPQQVGIGRHYSRPDKFLQICHAESINADWLEFRGESVDWCVLRDQTLRSGSDASR